MKRMKQLSAIVLLLTMFFYACEDEDNDSNGNDMSNLSENEQMLIGTWLHVATEGGVAPGPVDYAEITWTFNADYTGEFYQKVYSRDSEDTRDFNWRLDSTNILFTDAQGNGEPQYRVEEWGTDTMRWYNYTLGDIYVVAKQ